jgi:ureidoglycolate lyase
MELLATPLSVDAFAPFGQVISAGSRGGKSANQGTAVRFDWLAKLHSTRPHAKPNVAVFRSEPKTLPLAVKLLERHTCSSQMFVPMRCARFLVVVCPSGADGTPELTGLRAFVCEQGQGLNYDVGVWHHPIIALDQPAELVMLAHEDGSASDCEEHRLSTPIFILGEKK